MGPQRPTRHKSLRDSSVLSVQNIFLGLLKESLLELSVGVGQKHLVDASPISLQKLQ